MRAHLIALIGVPKMQWPWRSSRLPSYDPVNDSDSEKDGNIVPKNGRRELTIPLCWALYGLFALFTIVIFVTIYLLQAGIFSNTRREHQVLKSPIPECKNQADCLEALQG